MTRLLRRLRLWLWCLWHNARYGTPDRWTDRDTTATETAWREWVRAGRPA